MERRGEGRECEQQRALLVARVIELRRYTPLLQIALMLTSGLVCAADRQEKAGPAAAPALAPVQVTALRDPVEKSYRKIVRGMDLFEQRRSLAPNASLRFKLLPRSRDTMMERIALSIVGEKVDIPVAVAPDNTFALERSQRALDDDAAVIPNRRASSLTWRADVRTPGLPPNTRRLGDLRLECLVGMEADLVSGSGSVVEQIARAIADHGYCEQRMPEYFFFAERPLWSVTLAHGSRREILSIDHMYAGMSREIMTSNDLRYCDCVVLLDRTYYAPLGDRTWPDDTLLELEFMDDDIDRGPQ
jgi:hypothetical protein